MPPDPCPAGRLALPGETTCHDLMDCGEGTWGALPVDGDSIFVDASYPGADADGSIERPWPSVADAIAAAPAGALVAIAAGSYEGSLVLEDRPLRLWGVCPDQVSLVGVACARSSMIPLRTSGRER